MNLKNSIRLIGLLALLIWSGGKTAKADGGMYPISQLERINLQQAGLNIPLSQLYNPDSISILNAIVRIGGCTGSFISDQGLILTNHHCVFGSLKPHSKEGQNYMETGFLANEKSAELPMKGTEVKIMLTYEDVSAEVLEGVEDIEDPIERQRKLTENAGKLQAARQAEEPDYQIEVSEMLVGKSYILFKYQMLKDLRLVYVPARTIGEFGGATDNWEWPRHTGDFSFVRAYVGPNGEPAPYSEDNIPFEPDMHLEVNEKGLSEEDFMFILGYPGRTYKNRSAEFIRFQNDYQLPYIANWFEFQIGKMTALTQQSEELKIKYDPQIKRLANVSKNYRGKLKSIAGIDLYHQKKEEEREILEALSQDKEKQAAFQEVLDELAGAYEGIFDRGNKIFWYSQTFGSATFLQMAETLNDIRQVAIDSNYSKKAEVAALMERKNVKALFRQIYNNYDENVDMLFLSYNLRKALDFKGGDEVEGLQAFFNIDDEAMAEYSFNAFLAEGYRGEKGSVERTIDDFLRNAYRKSIFTDTTTLFKLLDKKPHKMIGTKDPFFGMVKAIADDKAATDSVRVLNFSKINAALPSYVDMKMEVNQEDFVPDANATLRLTYGYIKGYSPRNSVYYEPFTTLTGIVEKSEESGDYKGNAEMLSLIDNTRVEESKYYYEPIQHIPVNMLYNTDTSGGNSGSPILDKNGHLVGLNFDRTYEATINDFAWDDAYSRSIGVDIRFMLWCLKNLNEGQAAYLLDEMKTD